MLARLRTCLLLVALLAVSAPLAPTCLAQDSTGLSQDAPATSGSPLPTKEGGFEAVSEQYAEATELYNKAVNLIATLRTRSIALVPPPSTSLFSSASYTPLLDLIEAAGQSPLSSVVKFLRRYTAKPAQQQQAGYLDENDTGWSLLGALYKISGASQLLGDYYGASEAGTVDHEKRTKKVMNTLNSGGQLSRSDVQFGLALATDMLQKAGEAGKDEAWETLGDLAFWGTYGAEQNLTVALHAYERVAERTGSPTAQYNVGFIKSTGLAEGEETEGDQAAALLYYTFAALGGSPQAEMTVGYRHWVGIGTKQSCGDALPFYKSAADKAIKRFDAGPPGGLSLPPTKLRLSDLNGGVYGPGASVSSPNANAHKQAHQGQNHEHPTTQQEWEDVLEFYSFHAERGDASFMFRLGRIYYQGFGSSVSSSTNTAGTGKDFARALKWFTRITRSVWPRDPPAAIRRALASPTNQIAGYDIAKDLRSKQDEHQYMVAALAAGYMGRMYLRAEGVPQDFSKAFLWFSRGSASGDHQSHNGLGLMYRDGLGVATDTSRALQYFQSAANENMAEAQVNLGKLYLASGDYQVASQYFESAVKNGNTFQAFYYLAELNAHAVARPDLCPVAVSFYKIVAERGDWDHEVWSEAEKAWARGDQQRALLGYWMMAERGYEAAQNNVAFILDRDKSALRLPSILKAFQPPPGPLANNNVTDRLALIYWTRSAAQDNIDALVKMGDYYLNGIGLPNGRPQPQKAAACYQTASSTHVSALAMHSLGWMHEVGLGVNKDFHLAKRYYDLALETNSEAYLPVVLSLFTLHLRSIYQAITGGDVQSLTMNNPFTKPLSPTERDQSTEQRSTTAQERLYLVFHHLINLRFGQAFNELFSGGRRPQPQAKDEAESADPLREAQRSLSGSTDPVQWAKEARERERDRRVGEEDEEDFIQNFTSTGGDGEVWESLAIVGLCMAVGWLIWHRQARMDAARAANEEARRREAREGIPMQ